MPARDAPPILTARMVDITTLAVDAIVNAANERLARGGGVCGAIHAAAGPELAEACRRIGGCPTGEARTTLGFNLPAHRVIHAVGPVWHGGDHNEGALLAYAAALEQARIYGCRTLAFPAIATGIYGFPLERATRIAVRVCREQGHGREITFACISDVALNAYLAELG
jgi:O-acetyl-ADP-ribose deacetylase (regulator of RNase III)